MPVIAAASDLWSMNGCLLIEIDVSEVDGKVRNSMKTTASLLNSSLNGNQELIMGHQIVTSDGNVTFEILSENITSTSCVGSCASSAIASQSMMLAVVECHSGILEANDATGLPKIAAYACIPSIQSGIPIVAQNTLLTRSNMHNVLW